MFDLTGRVALVTGAGQNVGAGIAHALAGQGAHVLVNDVDIKRAAGTADAVAANGGTATAVPFDVTDLAAVTSALASQPPVDIAVNNAGNGGTLGMRPTPFVEMDPADWDGPIDVNLRGVMHVCRAVVASMIDRGWGRVVTISSGAGASGVGIGVSPYSAGKGGGLGFMRSLALEIAGTGVTANSVALGLMGNAGTSDVTAHLARSVPVKRLGSPADVGAMCVYLASEEASWLTAQTINLNGGSVTS
ncbi:MAG: SDR family NAD(P)-dependent oxidoreductase [Acidimicrobiales bacterium]